jgi:hypothetical protein
MRITGLEKDDNMKKIKTISIVLCMLVLGTTASTVLGTPTLDKQTTTPQPPVEWIKTYGGDMIDWGNCIQQTSDGGYIISGTYGRNAWSLWFSYFYLVKIDASGNEEWNQVYGPYDAEHVAKCIQQTTDGGYIIAGYQGVTYKYDIIVQKTDSLGNLLWSKTFGDPNAYDAGHSVQQTDDGGYIITGTTNSFGAEAGDAFLLKLDESGNQQWIQTFGGADMDAAYWVEQSTDGGYVITGETSSYGAGGDVYLVKTDASGNEEWHTTFGGTEWDGAYYIQQTTDGGYVLSGWYGTPEWTTDMYVIKTDSSGNQEWSQYYGGTDTDEAYCIQQTSDGGYFITGYMTDPINFTQNVYVIKTDAAGALEWDYVYDNAGQEEYGYCGFETTDLGYIVVGSTGIYLDQTVDVLVLKFQGTNQPPEQPQNPDPQDGSQDVAFPVNLSWTCEDPDGDPLTYQLYFGTNPIPPLVVDGLTDPSYNPGELLENTTYYWKVKAVDSYGASTESPLWMFTTKQEKAIIELTEMTGGFGVSVVISNTGTADAEQTQWTVEVNGGLFGLLKKTFTGTIDHLAGGASESVSTGVLFGLGKIQITATAGDASLTKEGIQFFIFTSLH